MATPGDSGRLPRRTSRQDLAGLALTPLDGFVLSQIDGRTSAAELEMICGQSAEQIGRCLERLTAHGLVEPAEPAAPSPPPAPACAPAAAATAPDPEAARAAVPPPAPADAPEEESWLERPKGLAHEPLTDEEVKRIDQFLVRSAAADFYALLGVKRGAKRPEIRTAYFRLAKQFHPDAYYGRSIGAHQAKLERIFRQVARAYDVLSKTASRKKYDEYLKDQSVLQGQVQEEAAAEEQERRDSSHPPAPLDPDRVAAAAAAGPAIVREVVVRAGGEPPAEARDALSSAAKGAMDSGAKAVPATREKSASDAWHRQRLARQLTSMLHATQRAPEVPRERGATYLTLAQAAVAEGEWGRVYGLLEAAERFGLEPDEAKLKATLMQQAAQELSSICIRQAKFAESTGDVESAVSHAEKACKYGGCSAENWDMLARMVARTGRDLHRARDASLKALALEPKSVPYRMTLVKVYLIAGLPKSARKEAETVLEMESGSDEAKLLLAEAKKALEGA